MSDTTPRAGLPLLAAAQAQKHVTHNEALLQLDALAFARFLDRDLTAPPTSPADGDTYLVAAAATGDWTGKDGQIAYAVDGAWRFAAPFTGLAAFVVDEAKLIVFTGAAWVDYASILNLQNVPLLGVNTTADTTNKLAAKSAAILFDNVGNGVQAKLNKHASGDTASLLYQTNYSGRAEIGLTGDDNFHFKVSPNGSSWFDGLDIANADGGVDFVASEATVASAATADLGATSSLKVQITGTTTIASFGTKIHKLRFVRFAGALTLTHNATSLVLLGGASRVTAAGDVGIYTSDASGNWRERGYLRAASDPGDAATKSGSETLTNKTLGGAILAGTLLPDAAGTRDIGSGAVAFRNLNLSGGVGVGRSALSGILLSAVVSTGNSFAQAKIGSAGNWIFGQNSGPGGADDTFGFYSDTFAGVVLQMSGASGNTVFSPAGSGAVAIGSASPVTGAKLDVAGNILPHADNSYNLGSASFRFATVYAGTGTINTSGAATKTNIAPVGGALLEVAKTLAQNVRVYQFCDAVARKSPDRARSHFGMVFEDVVAAFARHGLDPMRYGIVCRDPAGPETGAAGQWTLGLRYDELAQFIFAGLAARLAALEATPPSPPKPTNLPKGESMLNGYKTYIVATLAVLGALGGFLDGDLTPVAALNLAIPALLSMTVRHGIATAGR